MQAEKEQAIADIRRQFPELVNTDNAGLREQLALMEGLAVAAIDRAEAQRKAQQDKELADAYGVLVADGGQFVARQQQSLPRSA